MSTLAEYISPTFAQSRLPTEDELPHSDGIPMETGRHRIQMELLIRSLSAWATAQGDVYAGGNQFLYFSPKQIKNQDFRGPDVFVVRGVDPRERKSWVAWDEGKVPDVVIELISETTAAFDKGKKREIYEQVVGIPNYYWFDPFNPKDSAGFVLEQGRYRQLEPGLHGMLPCPALDLSLRLWQGTYHNIDIPWLRWTDAQGRWLPLPEEAERLDKEMAERRMAQERQAKELAEQRAIAAEAELARLRAALANR